MMNASSFITKSNRVAFSRSENEENRRYVHHYEEERRRRVEGPFFTEVVQTFERSQQLINQKLDHQSKTLDATLKSLATLPQTIKTEVLNSTEFKKIQSRSLRNDDEVHKVKKRIKFLEASIAEMVEYGAGRHHERRSSTHSHHKSSRDGRSSATSSSAQRSRSEGQRDKKSKSKELHGSRDRSSEGRKIDRSRNKSSEGQNFQSTRNVNSRGRAGLSINERSTSRAEPSGRRDYEPQPGPSGVVTARFTRDGRTVHRRQDLDQVDSDDDRFSTTRDWHTRRARGPGDPPLRKGKTATGKAVKKGPINRIREKSVGKKRKTFLYGTREKAINEIERLMKSGIDSDEAIFRITKDKGKTKLFEDAEESHLKIWYAARKDIREKIRLSPRIRNLRACKGL